MKFSFRMALAFIPFFLAPLFLVARAETPPKKIVIFSASYGAGHNTSASAIKKQLEAAIPNVEVKILYTENYMRFGLGEYSKEAFNKLYQNNPSIYDKIFQATMKSAVGKKRAADIPQPAFKEKEMLADLIKEDPDLVFSTHHISTHMLDSLRKKNKITPKNFKIGWVDTDFVHKPYFYLGSLAADKTFMAHPALMKTRTESFGIPAEKMASTGLPINPVVFEEFSAEAKKSFFENSMDIPDAASATEQTIWVDGKTYAVGSADLPRFSPEKMTVTIASGKAGLGDYPVIFDSLVKEANRRSLPLQVVAVCGENEKNYKALTQFYDQAKAAGRLKNIDLTVSHLMDNAKLMKYVRSSSLFIGKSGSQSPVEAAIMGVPSVLLDVLGGQEHHTASFFEAQNLAVVVGKKNQSQAGAQGFALLEDPLRMQKLNEAQALVRTSYTMKPIEDFTREALAETHASLKNRLASVPQRCGWKSLFVK